jgi:8-oxo-dGTP pyrophosphatase MutT (NUDIX family)
MSPETLKTLLQKELPGELSHRKLAPYRVNEDYQIPKDARLSAVCILLIPSKDQWEIVLIERPKYDGVHSGQMAFPGGRVEDDDIDLYHTAIRECEEEVAFRPQKNDFIAKLSPIYIPTSNFWVHPYVFILDRCPDFMPDKREVHAIHLISLAELLKDESVKSKTIELSNGLKLKTPYFDLNNTTIWGATAAMLSELKDLINA